ncbi:MAG: LacI family transcriptional regulator [Telmatospirillum sp.]|nr:LacI family transcriptional regulator [Telmatospirillum sp.]
MATIRDVAREAGVSTSTVSHVINRTRYVAPDTVRQVRDAIERLGYAPSEIARALKIRRTHTIGMIVPSSANPFFGEVLRGVEDGCYAHGYSLILCNSDDRTERLLSYLNALRSKRIDGLLVITGNSNPDGLDRLVALPDDLPLLLLDAPAHDGVGVVAAASREGGRLAARFLAGRGFRRIACIGGPEDHPRAGERLAGFREGLHDLGLDTLMVCHAALDVGAGQAAMARLLRADVRPDAVFCCNDLLAIGALSAAFHFGVDVPEALSVMGYDDIGIAAYTAPPLSTVRQPASAIGRTAADILIGHLEQDLPIPPTTLLQPLLIDRRSVGRAPEGTRS